MEYIIMLIALVTVAVAFYKIGNGFGTTAGYRKARGEFDVIIEEMRADEKELAEAFAGVKKQIAEIEKAGKFED